MILCNLPGAALGTYSFAFFSADFLKTIHVFPWIDTVCTVVHNSDDHLVVTMGLKDMLVVHTPDATLVASRAHEEAVRRVVVELEKRGWNEFL